MKTAYSSRSFRVLVAALVAAGAGVTQAPTVVQAQTLPVTQVAVPNPSFELTLGDYAPAANTGMWRPASAYDGVYSLQVTAKVPGSAYVAPRLPLVTDTVAGATYTASVHAAPFTLNRTARLEVVETAPDGTTAVTAGSAELTTSGWRKITVAHMATGTGNAISFRLGSAQLGTNEAVRFDAVEVGVTPPPKPRTLVFGSSAATKTEILTHEADLGRTLTGVRQYRKWNGKLFAADAVWARDTGHTLFVSIRSERTDGTTVPYADVATAQPGSAIYNEILAQAEQIKAFGAEVYITYNHEPEAAEAWSMGDGPEFAAAWRRIIDIYRAAGVTNAEYVWTLTGYAFKRTDSRAAAHYWPGVDYVDHIGADVYNWGTCRGGGSWVSMAAAVEPLRKWATQYPTKGVVLMEYSSVEDAVDPTRKAQWWNEAAALFQQPGYEQFQGVLQWSGRNFTHTYDCSFDYKSSVAATQAMQAMGASPAYQARYLDME